MNTQNTSSVLNQGILDAQEILSSFAFQDELLGDLTIAFGDNYNQEVASQLFTAFAQGDFSAIPEIKILSNDVLEATNGAYSAQKNKIYLNERFLEENADNPQAVATLLIEEIGHFIDAQINTVDSAGDEGDIFAKLVLGEEISTETLAALKAEDDTKTIVLDGEEIAIKQGYKEGDNGDNWLRYGLGAYDDEIRGRGGNDTIDGGNGDDTLYGDEGNDYLHGGSGKNILSTWTELIS